MSKFALMTIGSRNWLLIFVLLTILASCKEGTVGLGDIEIEWSDGEIRPALNVEDTSIKVFIFMSPECPLCINYTQPVLELKNRFDSLGVHFYVVYSGNYYSSQEIKEFESTYEFQLPAMYDVKNEVAKSLAANVTPQVFLLDANGEVMYSGAIDNWAFEPGKKRQKVTDHYLERAILSLLAGDQPAPSKTEAIGCFIEY